MRLLLLHFALYSILITFTFSAEFQLVKIGAIFFHDEIDLLNAFETAAEDINRREFDVRLETVKHFLSVDDSVVLQELACDLIENGVAAIFGPSSKATSDIVSVICNITGIPHLQFDWHEQDTKQQRRNRQLTVNVAPTRPMISRAYWEILKSDQFNWKSFTIAYEESSTSLGTFQHLLADKQLHKSGIKLQKFHRGDDYRILWKYISNAREKFVLLDCPADIVSDVVNTSIFFNMTGHFNHLFLTNLDTHLGGLGRLYSKDFTAYTSAVRLRPYIPSPANDEVDIFEGDQIDKIVTLQSQLIYDAVILNFNALRNVIRSEMRYFSPEHVRCGRGYWAPGRRIIEEMKILTPKNVTPPYKTQKLLLNADGERDDFNLEIYNPIIDVTTHVWNKNQLLFAYEDIAQRREMQKSKQTMFADKEDFSQKRVRYTVATRVGEPYFMWREEPEGIHYEGNERFEGYAVDLIYKLAEVCKFDFDFEPVSDNNYGSHDPRTDEWNGIIRQLMDNNAQLGICDLTITQARRSVVDFTVPFMQLGVSILAYKTQPPPKDLFDFLKPFALEVWLYLVLALIIIALVLVFMARISIAEWENPTVNEQNAIIVENKWSLKNTLWLNIGAIMTAGCDILPRGGPMRVFTAFWWIFALLMSQTYIAKLASFITTSKMEGSIRNIHDLVGQNYVQFGTVKGGSTSVLFSESNESDYRVAWNKMVSMKPEAFTTSNKEGVDRVKRSHGRYAFLMETTSLQYYAERNCDLTQIGEPIGEKHYGIAVPLNAPFRSNLSVGILRLSEKGDLYTLKNKWFNNATKCDVSAETSDDTQFTMESVGGLFIVLVGGVILSFLIAIGEFLWNVEKMAVAAKLPPMAILKAEMKFFLSFWLVRKPLNTYTPNRGSASTDYSSGELSSSSVRTKRKKKSKKNRNPLKKIIPSKVPID